MEKNQPTPAKVSSLELLGRMTPTQIEEWTRVRALGKKNFILTRGIYGFGAFMFLFSLLYSTVRDYKEHHFSWSHLVGWFFSAVITSPLSGYAYGWLMWSVNERKYRASFSGDIEPPTSVTAAPKPYDY